MKNKIVIYIGIAVVVLGAAGLFMHFSGSSAKVFAKDTTLSGDYSVASGARAVVKNGATLTVNGNLTVLGSLACDGGPLRLVVSGTFKVDGQVQCDRPETIGADDVGNGIVVVANSFIIGKSAVIISNGHVQMVTKAEKLATTKETIENLYMQSGTYTKEKFHIGPFLPFDQIPKGTQGLPSASVAAPIVASLPAAQMVRDENGNIFIHAAQAQMPAMDNNGNPVPNTTQIGGKWYVGNPGQAPPPNLTIPTPPKGVNHIILNFNFGNNGVTIQDFELTGPDGRAGTADVNKNCNAKGDKGEDALRFNVNAGNITINNFTLHLGAGGEGGAAETTKDCDPGTAAGGQGGQSGNFKMVAEEKFDITGSFDIYPGPGGAGGTATAHGKKGEDGCPGEKGGDTAATGGKGGDNTKGLVVSGTVSGLSNVTLHELIGGKGGNAIANGGNGGNGTGPGCAGGPGGKATATGGAGGNAMSVKATSIGGDGGTASSTPGAGGNGGQGSETLPGGNGGKGGDAVAGGGKGGTGKTTDGQEGKVLKQTGGNGGNGGDGCDEGIGGKGGSGKPNGTDGADGKNLCVHKVVPPSTTTPPPPPPPNSFFDVFFDITPSSVNFNHVIGHTQCPEQAGTAQVTGKNVPQGATWSVEQSTVPKWLNVQASGQAVPGALNFLFNCNIDRFETQTLTANVKAKLMQGTQLVKEATVQVTGHIQAQ